MTLEDIIKRQKQWREAFFSNPKGNYKQFSPTNEEKEFLMRLEQSKNPRYNNKSKTYNWDSV